MNVVLMGHFTLIWSSSIGKDWVVLFNLDSFELPENGSNELSRVA